jgi:3-phenylpropionate/trans-cinnamate dioxygenase ferredoxin subunit
MQPGEPSKPLAYEFPAAELGPGRIKLVHLGQESIAVYNVDGSYFATQAACTHQGGPLEEGDLEEACITCPNHGSRFDVKTGAVIRGPATRPLRTYRIEVDGNLVRVTRP